MAEKRIRKPIEALAQKQGVSFMENPLSRGRELSIYVAIWLFAFLLRAIYLSQIRATEMFHLLMGDAVSYDSWAQEIARGNWLGHEVFYQAPLYPYFLGLIYSILGRDFLLVRVVQVILGATSCLFIALAGRLFFCRSVGILAGVLLALCPSAIFFDCLVQKSVLDLFLLSFLLVACGMISQSLRSGWLVAGGAILGFLSLSRENALIFAFVVVTWLLMCFRQNSLVDRMKSTGLFLAGLALVLFPVALRNEVVGGEFHLTTSQFGANFYIGNNKAASGLDAPLRAGRNNPEFERTDATQLAETALGRKLSPSEVSSYWTQRALSYIRSDPKSWLRLMARKWFFIWNAFEIADTVDQYTCGDSSFLLRWLTRVYHFGVLCPLGFFGILVTWGMRNRIVLLYLTLASYAASLTLFFITGRYRFLLVAWLVMFAAAGLVQGYALLRARRFTSILTAAGLAIAIGLYANQWAIDKNGCRATTQHNAGLALLKEQDKTKEAIAYFRLALQLQPDFAQTHSDLGVALSVQGKRDEAISQFLQALRLQPDFADTHYNLANTLVDERRLDEAIAHYTEALRLRPDLAMGHYKLGNAFVMRGQLDRAIDQYQEALHYKTDYYEAHHDLANAFAAQGRSDEAIVHYAEALRLKPDSANAHYNLGNLFAARGRPDQAIAQYREALRNKPDFAEAHNNLGFALAGQGQVQEAIAHYEEALRLNPNHLETLNNLARLLATDKDERARNPAKAVELASRACELTVYQDPVKLDTLAMAYAEAGRFQEAIQTASRGIDLATTARNQELANAIRSRLQLYQLGKPYRE